MNRFFVFLLTFCLSPFLLLISATQESNYALECMQESCPSWVSDCKKDDYCISILNCVRDCGNSRYCYPHCKPTQDPVNNPIATRFLLCGIPCMGLDILFY